MKQKIVFFSLLIPCLLMSGCQSDWQISISTSGQTLGQITKDDVAIFISRSIEDIDSVPLGQILYAKGFPLLEQVNFVSSGNSITYIWDEIADKSTISLSGVIKIGDLEFSISEINLIPSPKLSENLYSILDIAPTIAYALELPELPQAEGTVRITNAGEWDRAVMINLDGLQFEKLETLILQNAIPFFGKLAIIRQGLTVYPPISTSASAAILTGTPPQTNQVYGYGYRSTETTTLFDLAVQNGLRVIAVEGDAVPFNLRNAETILSGDRDGNGYTNDNVQANSLDVITSDMPDILYIHFHDIDDIGHLYGPQSIEYEETIVTIDAYLSQIIDALPVGTLIAIFADHGMHTTQGGGNHGTLQSMDMIIPIIFLEK